MSHAVPEGLKSFYKHTKTVFTGKLIISYKLDINIQLNKEKKMFRNYGKRHRRLILNLKQPSLRQSGLQFMCLSEDICIGRVIICQGNPVLSDCVFLQKPYNG